MQLTPDQFKEIMQYFEASIVDDILSFVDIEDNIFTWGEDGSCISIDSGEVELMSNGVIEIRKSEETFFIKPLFSEQKNEIVNKYLL